MTNDLVARIDRVIADALLERAEANHRGDTNAPTVTDMTKRALAALGLDDMDAAVERAARAWTESEWGDGPWDALTPETQAEYLLGARDSIEAALTCSATEGRDDA